MTIHPAPDLLLLCERIEKDEIGGAIDMAREVAQTLGVLVGRLPKDISSPELNRTIQGYVVEILRVLPSFAPPYNAINHVLLAAETPTGSPRQGVLNAIAEFLATCDKLLADTASIGPELIAGKNRVFMYSMSRTVWETLKRAKSAGCEFEVFGTESRPFNEGMWTIKALGEVGIPVTIGIDAAIGQFVPTCDIALVGADAICANGDALCKVGTYPTAVIAQRHGVPFYVLADSLKYDWTVESGEQLRVDPVPRDAFDAQLDPDDSVGGTLFDITPQDLVTGYISERGITAKDALPGLIERTPRSSYLQRVTSQWLQGTI